MRILACPVAKIEAPVEIVLQLLELQNWGKWIDGKVLQVDPAGPMVVGQEATLAAKAFLISWKIKVKVIGIDKINRKIRYDVFDPFGLKNEEELEYTPLTNHSCRVQYNCNFLFADGLKGFLIKTFLGKKFIEVPAESIRRLKAAAESYDRLEKLVEKQQQ